MFIRRSIRIDRNNLVSRCFSSNNNLSNTRKIALEAAKRRKLKEETAQNAKRAAENKKRMQWVPYAGLGILGLGGIITFTDPGRQFYNDYVYESGVVRMFRSYFSDTVKEFTDPISENLLPDFPAELTWGNRQPPRTLVLDFEDTLCHLEWTRKRGWTAAKRPGVDMFLARLSAYYEIVIFTNGNYAFLEPYVEAIDPHGLVTHRLFRESTLYENGEHIKDMSKLNRDLSRVVVIDDQALKRQQENGVQIKPFTDIYSPDTELLDLLPFLEDLAIRDVRDVRSEIAKYKGKSIPEEFKKIVEQRRQQEEQKRSGTLAGFIRPKQHLQAAAAGAGAPMNLVQQEIPGMTSKDQADRSVPPKEQESDTASSSIWGSFLQK